MTYLGLIPSWISSAASHQTQPGESRGPPWDTQSCQRDHPSSHLSVPKIKHPKRKCEIFFLSRSLKPPSERWTYVSIQMKTRPSTGNKQKQWEYFYGYEYAFLIASKMFCFIEGFLKENQWRGLHKCHRQELSINILFLGPWCSQCFGWGEGRGGGAPIIHTQLHWQVFFSCLTSQWLPESSGEKREGKVVVGHLPLVRLGGITSSVLATTAGGTLNVAIGWTLLIVTGLWHCFHTLHKHSPPPLLEGRSHGFYFQHSKKCYWIIIFPALDYFQLWKRGWQPPRLLWQCEHRPTSTMPLGGPAGLCSCWNKWDGAKCH